MKTPQEIQEKTKGKTIWHIIDITILLFLISVIIFAQIEGKFIKKEVKIVETCNGIPTNPNITLILNQNNKPIDILENNKSFSEKQYKIKEEVIS